MWAKVDDKLFSHPKWLATSTAGKALWVSALSWCASQEGDGCVPTHVLPLLGATKAAARSLVASGLWEEADGGWAFHDWIEYQPDGATAKAVRAQKSSGGREGNHRRWHVKRDTKVAGCEFCESESDRISDRGSESEPNPPVPGPVPVPDTYVPTRGTGTPRNARDRDEPPEPNPQPEMSSTNLLAAAGLARHEIRDFLVDLKGTGARNTTALVNALHRDGKLAARIAEWRDERNLAAEAASRPAPGRRTTDDRVADGFAIAEEFRALEQQSETDPNVIPFRQIEGA